MRPSNDGDPLLEARIQSYELAAKMQLSAPAAFDLSQESADTLAHVRAERSGAPPSSAGGACWLGE